MDFIDELITDSVPPLFLAEVQKLFRKTFSSPFDISSVGFRKFGSTRTSKPFSNIKVKIVLVVVT